MRAIIFRLSKIPTIGKLVLALPGLAIAVVAVSYLVERSRLRAVEKEITYGKPEESAHFWKFEMPGLQEPPAQPATESKIGDGDEVIGVVVNGRPRAYWLKALKYPPWHIVNDVVDGVPLSVTHCDRTNCTRVYTGARSPRPLDLNLGGLYGREMIVKAGGALYFQETGKPFEPGAGAPPLPYADHPWERTTWKAWRQRHPETDVFIGLEGIGPKP
jgi:Protein of unknown function (DUF3179)